MRSVFIFFIILTIFVGCGTTSNNGTSVDIADYYSTKNRIKSFYKITDTGENNLYDEEISVDKNIITVKINNIVKRVITINDKNISEMDGDDNITKIIKRVVEVGKVIYSLPKSTVIKDIKVEETILGQESIQSVKTCRLDSKIEQLNNYDIKYNGDILKFKCIESKTIVTKVKDNLPSYITLRDGEQKSDYDISYFYMKWGVGLIAKINDDCIIESGGVTRVNDQSVQCKEKRYTHTFYLDASN
jgi:hypothetical protein